MAGLDWTVNISVSKKLATSIESLRQSYSASLYKQFILPSQYKLRCCANTLARIPRFTRARWLYLRDS